MAYSGIEITIPLGNFGLFTDDAPMSLPPGALIEAKNVVFNNGVVQKAPGAREYSATALGSTVMGFHDWWPVPELQRMIALTSAGSLFRDTGNLTFSGGTAITTGLQQVGPNSMFIEGGNETLGQNKKLFLLTFGKNQVQVLDGDGTVFTDIAAPAADWVSADYPKVGTVHRNRLWLFSGNRAYGSNTGDHENFTSSIVTQSIFPGEGGDIIGVFVFKGRMFVFKEGNFVYFLNESDPDTTNWYWQKLASNFGIASPNCIVQALDDMLVGNSTGTVTSYSAAESLGDIESADLFRASKMERYHRANSHPKGLPEMHGLYDEELKQVYFTYRSTYKNDNDRLINLDANNQNVRISFLDKGVPVCLGKRRDSRTNIPVPMYGSTDGKIYFMNQEDRLEGAVSYIGRFQTAFTDFKWADPQVANRQKHFDWLTLEYVPEGAHSVSIEYFIDGKYIDTVTVSMEADEDYLGTVVLGTDRLAQYTTQSNRVPLTSSGKRISFRVSNSGSNESFQISGITVGFRAGGQDDTRY